MKGGIYTSDKCGQCGTNLKFDTSKEIFYCPRHPEISGSGRCFVRFGKDVNQRFKNPQYAVRFLNHLRVKVDDGSYDPLDYQASRPYSFTNVSEKYLQDKEKKYVKKGNVKPFRNIKRHIQAAQEYFGDKNIKEFKKIDFLEFAESLGVSEKTQDNYLISLSAFWKWVIDDMEMIDENYKPKIPRVVFQLNRRPVTDYSTQQTVMNEVEKMTKDNPKICLAIKILSYNPNIRPDDIRRIKEGDILLDEGCIVIRNATKTERLLENIKTVWLMPEDIKAVKKLKDKYPATPEVKFFRHCHSYKGINKDDPFGEHILNRYWKKACEKLHVDPTLTLYPGTKHTTTTAIAEEFGEQEARQATGHQTNKAFLRYCQAPNKAGLNYVTMLKERDSGEAQVFDFSKKGMKK